jgi:hypothetical protein
VRNSIALCALEPITGPVGSACLINVTLCEGVILRICFHFIVLQAGGATIGVLSYAAFHYQCVISPTAVHRDALRLLRADPAIQEVLKLPLAAEKPLLSIVDGGRIRFKVQFSFCTLNCHQSLNPELNCWCSSCRNSYIRGIVVRSNRS